MASHITVRRATPADHGRIADICVTAYDAAGQLEPRSPYTVTLRDAASRDATGILLVAEQDGDVVGTTTICPTGTEFSEIGREGELEFRFLAVDPAKWCNGIADALVAACEDHARAIGASALAICVRDTNTGAAAMYERRGFTRVPDRDWTPRPGVDLLALTRPVPPDSVVAD